MSAPRKMASGHFPTNGRSSLSGQAGPNPAPTLFLVKEVAPAERKCSLGSDFESLDLNSMISVDN